MRAKAYADTPALVDLDAGERDAIQLAQAKAEALLLWTTLPVEERPRD